jgi:hypothetical protein
MAVARPVPLRARARMDWRRIMAAPPHRFKRATRRVLLQTNRLFDKRTRGMLRAIPT